jgi:hypothetical protein
VSNSSLLLAFLFPYRISALGILYDQLTLKLVAVTGCSVPSGLLGLQEFRQKSYGSSQSLDCGLGSNMSF